MSSLSWWGLLPPLIAVLAIAVARRKRVVEFYFRKIAKIAPRRSVIAQVALAAAVVAGLGAWFIHIREMIIEKENRVAALQASGYCWNEEGVRYYGEEPRRVDCDRLYPPCARYQGTQCGREHDEAEANVTIGTIHRQIDFVSLKRLAQHQGTCRQTNPTKLSEKLSQKRFRLGEDRVRVIVGLFNTLAEGKGQADAEAAVKQAVIGTNWYGDGEMFRNINSTISQLLDEITNVEEMSVARAPESPAPPKAWDSCNIRRLGEWCQAVAEYRDLLITTVEQCRPAGTWDFPLVLYKAQEKKIRSCVGSIRDEQVFENLARCVGETTPLGRELVLRAVVANKQGSIRMIPEDRQAFRDCVARYGPQHSDCVEGDYPSWHKDLAEARHALRDIDPEDYDLPGPYVKK